MRLISSIKKYSRDIIIFFFCFTFSLLFFSGCDALTGEGGGTNDDSTAPIEETDGDTTDPIEETDGDTTPPTANSSIANGSLINGSTEIIITFSESMAIASTVFGGTMAVESAAPIWSQVTNLNDQLTISPSSAWSEGVARTITIDVKDLAGNPLDTLNLFFQIDNPPIVTSDPLLTMAPNPDVPLAGLIELSTNEPTRVTLTMSDGTKTWPIDFDEYFSIHSLPVLGFRPDKTHTIQGVVTDEVGNQTELKDILVVTTAPLPSDFPDIQIIVSQPEKMEPGVTILDVSRIYGEPQDDNYLIIVDEAGEVMWFYRNIEYMRDARRISTGNLFFIQGSRKLVEMDMLGNVVQMWHAAKSGTVAGSTPVDAFVFHHEASEMPSGNFLVLTRESGTYDNYPTSETDPGAPLETATVRGDVVLEISRDGTIVNTWSMLDLLDPYRIGYNSLNSSPNDWSHGNAAIYDSGDDTIIVSLRHQDAVVKITRAMPHQIVWILSSPANWIDPWDQYLLTPVGGFFEWSYHQHAPEITSDGNILLFDNGNFRASPFDDNIPQNIYSRAVEYSINEGMMEIAQVWEYGANLADPLYSRSRSDADQMPTTGNVLITFGDLRPTEQNVPSARIVEVTHATPGEIVFEIAIADDNPNGPAKRVVYRSNRLPSLYP